jgi:hypothetical protein
MWVYDHYLALRLVQLHFFGGLRCLNSAVIKSSDFACLLPSRRFSADKNVALYISHCRVRNFRLYQNRFFKVFEINEICIWSHTLTSCRMSSLSRNILNFHWNRDSSVTTATMPRAGQPDFDSRQGLVILLWAIASRLSLASTPPPVQWVPEENRPRCKSDHSPPYSVSSWRGAKLSTSVSVISK